MISTEALRHFPYFAGVSAKCLKAVAAISTDRTFKAGERLFEESNAIRATDKI